jgi:hypothetical protein
MSSLLVMPRGQGRFGDPLGLPFGLEKSAFFREFNQCRFRGRSIDALVEQVEQSGPELRTHFLTATGEMSNASHRHGEREQDV